MDRDVLSYDVVVVGGGAAGLAAAVAAGGAGGRTALVERYGFLGGMATAGMVGTICGLYHGASSGSPEPLNEGFAETFAGRLAAMPGCQKPVRRGRTFVLPYTSFAFACLADDLVTATPQLDVHLHAYLAGVETGPRRIEALRVVTWERTIELRARVVVDTSGDGAVACHAGAATETASDRQLPALVFVLQHVDCEALAAGSRLAVLRTLVAAERAAIEMAYFHGFSYREVASRLDVPEGTVKNRIRTGLARLREQLATEEEPVELMAATA